jgi:hypothetical protein
MKSLAEIVAGAAVELVFIALAAGLLYRVWGWFFPVPRRQTVQAFQRGVLLKAGKLEKILTPGAYWITPKRTLLLCDVRPTPFQIQAQELAMGDGLGVRISLGYECRIVEPVAFVSGSSDAYGAFFLEVRQALRVAVGELTRNEFHAGETSLADRLNELLLPKAAHLGIEITKLDVWESVPIGSPGHV